MDFNDKNIFMVEWDYLYTYNHQHSEMESSELRTTGARFDTREDAVHFIANKLDDGNRNIKLFKINKLELKVNEVNKEKVLSAIEEKT